MNETDDQEPAEHDVFFATADRIQRDRRSDEAPRTALEMVRADKLAQSVTLLESVRHMCMAVIGVLVVLAIVVAFMIDYMTDNRARLDANRRATEQVDVAFAEFNSKNEAFLDNHARSQRLICAIIRIHERPLPDNGDCDHR